MAESPAPPLDSQRIARLARTDRAAATAALETQSPEAQAAIVCAAPLARRNEMLGLLPDPEKVVPLLPEAELCFTVKAMGIGDAAWLLQLATPEQVVACVDLDMWRGNAPDRSALDDWVEALAHGSDESFMRSVLALDPELVVMFLKHRVACFQKPDDDEGWDPPEGTQTLDGQFYFGALEEGDDVTAVRSLLQGLFTTEYWTYFRMLQGVIHELEIANEDWALRWRVGRLEDLGFPAWDRAMEIYRSIRPEARAELPKVPAEAPASDDTGEWQMPVWMPELPASVESEHLLFRTLATMGETERRRALFAVVALANKIAVADGMPLGEAESTPKAIAKAAKFASAGLEYIAAAHSLDPAEVVERTSLERLFSVGANLDPESARPSNAADRESSAQMKQEST